MALQRSALGSLAETHPGLVSLLVIVGAVAIMLGLSAILGVQGTGPSYDLVPDPAGLGLPF